MFKGIVTLTVSAKVRAQVQENGEGQSQVTVHFPVGTKLGICKRKQAAVKLYRIPESKKVTKECLVGEFRQADSHALWLGHQVGAARGQHQELFATLTEGGTQFYAVYSEFVTAGEVALDLSELE